MQLTHKDVLQLMKYVDWVKNEYAFGDYGMIKAFIVGNEFTEDALAEFLLSNPQAFAMLDVLSVEQPNEGNRLFSIPNVAVTPHIAWNSQEADERLASNLYAAIIDEARRHTGGN